MVLIKEFDQYVGLKENNFKSEKEVEDMIFNTKDLKDIFGETLFIIGRQIGFEDINDTIDVLAIDKQGKLVIIEIKRSFLSGTSSLTQASRYAGYVSLWSLLHIKNLTEDYFLKEYGDKVNFEKKINDFLDVDLSYVNQDQKIVLMGSESNEKLFSAANWLFKQGVNLELIRAAKYKSKLTGKKYIDIRKIDLDKDLKVHAPKLKSDYNKVYHLKTCSWTTQKLVEAFVETIVEFYDFEGPFWDNKTYVYFTQNNKNILEFWINKNSIKVQTRKDYQRRTSVDKVKVINALKEKLDFSIDDKISFKF